MENIANLRVHYNDEVISNLHEGMTFVCECSLSFAIPCTMSFVELQNRLCNNIQSHILKRLSDLLYRSHVQVFGGLIQFQIMPITDDASIQQMLCIYQQTQSHVPMIELYVEFEQQSVDDKNDGGDLAGNPAVQNKANAIVSQHPFGVPSFMRTLDLEVMHAPEIPEYANTGEGNAAAKDGEFSVGMEFGSRESVISAIKSYNISRGVYYTVYESKPQTFYAKCKGYGAGCDWLNRASLIRKKACWEIRRYNGKHMCTVGTISQDHAKFNHTVSYHKAWLAKQKAVAKVFGDWEVSYQTLPVWLKVMTVKMPRSRVQIKTLPVYRESEEVQGVRVLHRVFWSFYPCIVAFRHCKPLVQVDGTHLYGKYKGALLVVVAQDGNKNIVPIAFAIVEGETADAWEFSMVWVLFLTAIPPSTLQ
ncbi:hypothetical protein Ahy_B05g075162 [Arachis hypogaea]|uniref:MULE transposase domain-containing protein n=1 Tax=Arachis hypogaea TaxID=3818 RepID=A0A444Z0Q4_ARAHY|nr:hypothetical protein Ahy_B05g075162 [Arachis hypogaea]